jgi:hypothetical protein
LHPEKKNHQKTKVFKLLKKIKIYQRKILPIAVYKRSKKQKPTAETADENKHH